MPFDGAAFEGITATTTGIGVRLPGKVCRFTGITDNTAGKVRNMRIVPSGTVDGVVRLTLSVYTIAGCRVAKIANTPVAGGIVCFCSTGQSLQLTHGAYAMLLRFNGRQLPGNLIVR